MFVNFPEIQVQVGRFNATVRTSYVEVHPFNEGPTAYASVQGDSQNFVCTAGDVSVVYDSEGCDCGNGCKGTVAGFAVHEKWNGEAIAFGIDLAEAVANFGIAVAAQLR